MSQITLRVVAPPEFPNAFFEAKSSVLQVVAKHAAANPDIQIYLAGTVMINNAFIEFALDDQKVLVPLMFLLIVLAMTLMLRSFMGMVLPMLILITSIIFPIMLFVGIFGYPAQQRLG